MTASQPVAKRSTPECGGRLRDRPGVGRIERPGKPRQKLSVIGQQSRLSGDDRHDVPVCQLAENGDQLMTDPVAQVGRVSVGRILDGAQLELKAQGVGLGSAQSKNRMSMTQAHRCETICRRTAEKVEQDGLCLVVGCVAGGGTFRQGSEPGRARPRFEVGPGGDDHLVDDDFDTESRGELVDDMYVLV